MNSFCIARLLPVLKTSLSGLILLTCVASSFELKAQTPVNFKGHDNFFPEVNLPEGDRILETADLNGDGLTDIMTAGTGNGELGYYLNQGGGELAPQDTITTQMEQPVAVHAADFDGDGDLDVVSCSKIDDRVVLFDNDLNSSGSFGPLQELTIINGPSDIFPADLNNDGRPDIVIAADFDDILLWLENLGNGSFSSDKFIDAPVNTINLEVADFDSDGDQDIVTNNSGVSFSLDPLLLYENQGTGTFVKADTLVGIYNEIQSISSGDVDGDGDLDVVAGLMDSSVSIVYIENLGGGNFAPHDTVATSVQSIRTIDLGDVDQDGDLDIAAGSQADSLVWIENLGGGSFSGYNPLPGDFEWVSGVRFIDLDNDGKLDIMGASYKDSHVFWYQQQSTGFGPQQMIASTADGLVEMIPADLDNDGDDDVVYATSRDNKLAWHENNGTLRPLPQQLIAQYDAPFSGLIAVDLDGDSDKDLAITSYQDSLIAWYPNQLNATGNFGARQVLLQGVHGPRALFAMDVDMDNDPDLVYAPANSDSTYWLENNGNGLVAAPQFLFSSPNGVSSMTAGDWDGDGDRDIAGCNSLNNDVIWAENLGNGNFQPQATSLSNGISGNTINPRDVHILDSDLDGDKDLWVNSSHNLHIYENDGSGGLLRRVSAFASVSGPSDPIKILVKDFNNDGFTDAAMNTRRSAYILLNKGCHNFSSAQIVASGFDGVRQLMTLDLENDDDFDIIVADQYADGLNINPKSSNELFSYENRAAQDTCPAIAVQASTTPVTCPGAKDGTGSVDQITGGTPPYNYFWPNCRTSASADSLRAGQHVVRVTDSLGCLGFDTVSVGAPPPPFTFTSQTTPDSTGTGVGTATITVQGTAGPFTIRWNTDSTGSALTGLPAGTYYVRITDTSGCEARDTLVVDSVAGTPTARQPHSLGLDLRLFPNPTTGKLYIQGLEPGTGFNLEVYDTHGRRVISQQLQQPQTQLNLPTGLYHVRVRQGSRLGQQKLMLR
jgi:hypothetical protein